mmetsp:Transcript_7150/g.9271  ORF Transcript_7150/g.9271 Transcript_7150/m.9271 type:complete len:288 (-) Transcript_7150:149-1012(-)
MVLFFFRNAFVSITLITMNSDIGAGFVPPSVQLRDNQRSPFPITSSICSAKNIDSNDKVNFDKDQDWKSVVPKRKNNVDRHGKKSHQLSNPVWTPKFVRPIPKPNSGDAQFEQVMLLLVGIPGSGKSTFAYSLEKAMPWRYRRINQDSLGTRKKCESLCRNSLESGYSVVIDRCNFDLKQRLHFVKIATELNIPVDSIQFDISVDKCIERCTSRKFHETIKPDMAPDVVLKMKKMLRFPKKNQEQIRKSYKIRSIKESNELIQKYTKIMGNDGEDPLPDIDKISIST